MLEKQCATQTATVQPANISDQHAIFTPPTAPSSSRRGRPRSAKKSLTRTPATSGTISTGTSALSTPQQRRESQKRKLSIEAGVCFFNYMQNWSSLVYVDV